MADFEEGLPTRFTKQASGPAVMQEPEYTQEDFDADNAEVHGEMTEVERVSRDVAHTPATVRKLLGTAPSLTHKTAREKQMMQNELDAQEGPGVLGTIGNAIDNEWLMFGASRASERNSRGVPDPEWEMTPDMMQVEQGFTDDEVHYLMGSVSQEDYEARMGDIEEDRERARELDKAGWGGVVAQFAMSMLDPAMVAASFATGGLANGARATRMGNIFRGAGIAASENAALELVMMEGDTQRGWDSFMMSTLAGAALGGGIGAIRRVDATPAESGTIRHLDEVDSTMHRQSQDLQVDEASQAMTHSQSHVLDSEQAFEVANGINKHEIELGTVANKPHQGTKVRTKRIKQKKDLEGQVKQKRAERKQALAEFWSKTGVSGGIARQFDLARAHDISSRFDAEIDNLSYRLDDLQSKMDEGFKIDKAKKDFALWQKMTPEQKMNHVYPNYKKPDPVAQANKTDEARIANDRIEDDYESSFSAEGTVGAAKIEDPFSSTDTMASRKLDEMDENTSHLDDKNNVRLFGSGKLGKLMNTDFTNLAHSESSDIRALARTILENAQGSNAGNSASVLQWVNDKLIRSAQGFRVEKGYRMWAKEKGISNYDMATKPEYREGFNREVIYGIRGIGKPPQSEGIKLAMSGAQDQFAKALEINKASGVRGFSDEVVTKQNPDVKKANAELERLKSDNAEGKNTEAIASKEAEIAEMPQTIEKVHKGIEPDSTYTPDILDPHRLTAMAIDAGLGMKKTIGLISKGYQTGKVPLGKEQADMLATIKYNQGMDSALSQTDPTDIFKARSVADARSLLQKFKVSDEDIDTFFKSTLAKDDWSTISNRAKASKGINWEAELGGHRISDLMDTNLDRQLEAYTKETAFNSALAEKGIRSPGELNRVITEARKRARKDATAEEWPRIQEEFKVLEDNLTLLQGKSLVDYNKGFNKAGRMILDYTGLVRLQQMGFASIGEVGRGIHAAGLSNILSSLPSSGVFRRIESRDPKTMKTELAQMREVEEMTGHMGETNLMSSTTQRTDDFGSEATSVLGRNLDAGLEYGRRLNHFMSGFQHIQGGLEKVTANAINKRMLRHFKGKGKPTATIKRALEDSGLPPERWTEISDWVKKNGGKDDFNGRKIDTWNFSEMDHAMQTDLRALMTRLNNRAMQKGMVGEANTNWLGQFGRFATQFRMFSLTSLEKQLVHDVRGDKALAASMMATSTALAYVAYGAQVKARALLLPADEAEYYMDEMMTGATLHNGAFNKNNVLAGAGIIRDMGAILGALPEETMGSDRYGYLNQGGLAGAIPAVGMAQDIANVGNLNGTLWNQFRDDGDMQEDAGNLMKRANRALPFTNPIGIGEAIKQGLDN